MPTRGYIDIFSRGKWEDDTSASAVKFGRRVNKIPIRNTGEYPDQDTEDYCYGLACRDKLIAKEAPRSRGIFTRREFTGGVGVQYYIDLAAEARYRCFANQGVFDKRGPCSDNESRLRCQPEGEIIREQAEYIHEFLIEIFVELFRPRDPSNPDDVIDAATRHNLAHNAAGMFLETIEKWGHEVGKKILYAVYERSKRYKSVMPPASGGIDKRFFYDLCVGANSTFAWGSYSKEYTISSPHLLLKGKDFANAIDALFASEGFVEGTDRRPNIHGKRHLAYEAYFGVGAREHPGIWAETNLFRADYDINLAPLEVRDRMMSEIGVVPRRMDRLITDGKVFERVIPELGASILIDASGSMSISSETILEIVKLAPASVVAIYYGGSGYIKGKWYKGGFIVVLGENGQACSKPEVYRVGGGNYCDGEALRWLGLQPEPRFWVSDGQVTGPGDHMGNKYYEDAAWCLKQFDINWINTNDAATLVDIVKDYLRHDGTVLDTYREPAA